MIDNYLKLQSQLPIEAHGDKRCTFGSATCYHLGHTARNQGCLGESYWWPTCLKDVCHPRALAAAASPLSVVVERDSVQYHEDIVLPKPMVSCGNRCWGVWIFFCGASTRRPGFNCSYVFAIVLILLFIWSYFEFRFIIFYVNFFCSAYFIDILCVIFRITYVCM